MRETLKKKIDALKERVLDPLKLKAKLPSQRTVLAVSFLFIVAVDYTDFRIGEPIHLSALMLAPIGLVAWYVGIRWGLAFSALGAGYAGLNYYMNPTFYRSVWPPIWNFVTLFVFFSVYCWVIERLKKEVAKEHTLALTDHLSGLLNARAFFEEGQKEMNRSKRHGHCFTLCVLDLDNFKQVNDTMGHLKGDELIRKMAEILKSKLRDSDLAARLGGDEFATLLPETGLPAADHLASKLQNALVDGLKFSEMTRVTSSIGMVICYKIPDKLDEVVHAADTLMYQAKNSGKNQIKAGVIGRRAVDQETLFATAPEKELSWKSEDESPQEIGARGSNGRHGPQSEG